MVYVQRELKKKKLTLDNARQPILPQLHAGIFNFRLREALHHCEFGVLKKVGSDPTSWGPVSGVQRIIWYIRILIKTN